MPTAQYRVVPIKSDPSHRKWVEGSREKSQWWAKHSIQDIESWEMNLVEMKNFRTEFQFWEEANQVRKAGTLWSQTRTFYSLTGSQHDPKLKSERPGRELIKIWEYFGGRNDSRCAHTSFQEAGRNHQSMWVQQGSLIFK